MSTKVGVFTSSPSDSSAISAMHLAVDVKVDPELLDLLSDLFQLVEAVEGQISSEPEPGPPRGVERLLLCWILYTIGSIKARQALNEIAAKNLPSPDPATLESLGQLIYGDQGFIVAALSARSLVSDLSYVVPHPVSFYVSYESESDYSRLAQA